MAQFTATITWNRQGAVFSDNKYSRGHRWEFDCGITVPGSSSPAVVPPPLSVVEAVDPEEAFVASLSSCHMLWFLYLAGKKGFVVDDYRDQATGVMSKDAQGKISMTLVTLHPETTFAGSKKPTTQELEALHHHAHEECNIANSVKTEVRCEPVMR